MYPFLVTHEMHDEVIEERRSFVDLNVDLPSNTFAIPPNTQTSRDDLGEDSSRGWLAFHIMIRVMLLTLHRYRQACIM
jgi:hypothetical protein